MILPLVISVLLAAQAPASTRPDWIERLPEASGRLYAMGSAELGSQEGQAIGRASDRARLEVVARLRTTVRGQTHVSTRTTETALAGEKPYGVGQRQVQDDLSVGTRAEDLPGLVVEQTFTDTTARSVFALAYLDLAQARATLASRLEGVRQARERVPPEPTRKSLWRLRKLTVDLDRLEETVGLLALTGPGADLRPSLQEERKKVDARLDQLNPADLPPVDFSRMAMALRTNVDLPMGVEATLKSQIHACGLTAREMDPDLVLDLTFSGGSKGPEFIFADMDLYTGITYHLEAKLALKEAGGVPVTRTIPILIVQGDSPEGMVNQFRRQVERWLPRLLADYKAEMQ